MTERLRLWLERMHDGSGYFPRDAASGERVRRDDPRLRVISVAGVSFRPEALADPSFDPGCPLALVAEPENEYDRNAVGIWNETRSLQVGYVPRDVAGELDRAAQAVSLRRVEGGLRVLVVAHDAWVGRPRR